ncbi:MAG: hypothetical protein GX572_00110 [Clostridia bacterium]|nr:hypothetical protein [Clostridia bacterium]
MTKVAIIPLLVPDVFGEDSLGCDIEVYSDDATLADLLAAQERFAAAHLEDCRGCDACCQERAPLIAADIPALYALLPPSPYPATSVCAAFADIAVDKHGAADICLRRHKSGACCQLDTQRHICREHSRRPFVCRSHFCLPRSDALASLREQVINMGENALVSLLLAEKANGAPPLSDDDPLKRLYAEDYNENPMSGRRNYAQIRICDCIDRQLWQYIKKEG